MEEFVCVLQLAGGVPFDCQVELIAGNATAVIGDLDQAAARFLDALGVSMKKLEQTMKKG